MQWTLSQLSRALSGKNASSPAPFPDFVSTMIRSGLPARTALAEAKEQLGPGTDTTSATLAHILWGLAHDTQFQHELVSDLEVAGWPTDLTGLETVAKLKACVKEGIRWAGAATAMLPRVAPAEGVRLAGTYIPGGVRKCFSDVRYVLKSANGDLAYTDSIEQLSCMVSARQDCVSIPIFVPPSPLAERR
jgi:cytochrome P450